uniref:Uncharacterized protein n=1 Tax=Oryza sativa subsp. japonica TaxID=39947 RepID=Q8S7H5_ORYSJ|nr:hypothetical protein [Oryza sativa Japonica Group]
MQNGHVWVWGGRRGACARFVVDADAAGPRAASWLAVDRARERGRRKRLTGVSRSGRAEVAPTWRLRGCHAGRLEEDEGAGCEWTAGSGGFSGTPCDDEGRRGVHRNDEGEREGASQRLGFTGWSSTAADCGGGIRRREKMETATVRREISSGELEHLRDSGNPSLAPD